MLKSNHNFNFSDRRVRCQVHPMIPSLWRTNWKSCTFPQTGTGRSSNRQLVLARPTPDTGNNDRVGQDSRTHAVVYSHTLSTDLIVSRSISPYCCKPEKQGTRSRNCNVVVTTGNHQAAHVHRSPNGARPKRRTGNQVDQCRGCRPGDHYIAT